MNQSRVGGYWRADCWPVFYHLNHVTYVCTWFCPATAVDITKAVGWRPLQYENQQAVRVATQYTSAPCKLTISSHLFARWHLFRHVGYSRHQQQVDLWSFDLESGVRVTCDLGYLCANFSLPRPLCSRVRPDVQCTWQTDVRQKHRLMPPPCGGGVIIIMHRTSKRIASRTEPCDCLQGHKLWPLLSLWSNTVFYTCELFG